jgi:hypothetical protein
MKRVLDDPVLAQLDFLINGPPKAARIEEAPAEKEEEPPPPPPLLAPNPVLAQLDALINGAPVAAAAGPSAPAAAPPPLLAPLAPVVDDDDVRRGPPGILREFGGVRGWMARHAATSPARSTPPPSGVRRNSPSDQAS